MDVISLASGGGLFDYILRESGMNIKLQCEKDPIALKVLDKVFPESIKDNDIFALSKDKMENEYHIDNIKDCTFVTTLCCKPFSNMGKQKGKAKDTYMCKDVIKLINDCRPRFVLSENVSGFITHTDGLAYFSSELEKINYNGISINIPASLFGAPHERNRVFSIFMRDRVNFDIDWNIIVDNIKNKLNLHIDADKYNGKFSCNPGMSSVILQKPKQSDINYLRILGNGVEYKTGTFIATVLKECNDYYYDNNLMEELNDTNKNNYIAFFNVMQTLLKDIIPDNLDKVHEQSLVLAGSHAVFNIKRLRKLHKPLGWWQTPLASDGDIGNAYVHSYLSKFYPEMNFKHMYRNPELISWLMGIKPDLDNAIKSVI